MAKHPVEQAPRLDFSNSDVMGFLHYIKSYGMADAKGRYLHWSQMK